MICAVVCFRSAILEQAHRVHVDGHVDGELEKLRPAAGEYIVKSFGVGCSQNELQAMVA